MNQLPKRILSIDVLRAITMFLMIFVNDVAGVAKIPDWIEHTPADFDGMGFSDLIFPAFLFIVGLSMPHAIHGRLKRKGGNLFIFSYIFFRALALIIMGFFHVNLENYNHEQALLSYPVYTISLTVGFFLIWLAYPKDMKRNLKYGLIATGILIVVLLAFLYKGGNAEHITVLNPSWWGILGIIGWAYFFAAITYVVTRKKLVYLSIAFVLFASININAHLHWFSLDLGMIGDASSITLMLGGVLISTIYRLVAQRNKSHRLWIILAEAGLIIIVVGFLIRPYTGGISKIYSTPAWVFICMGITILVFELLIYLIDVKGKYHWFKWIKPAGTSTLTCYLLPYLLYSVLSLLNFNYPNLLNYGIGGMFRSVIVAFVVIGLVGLLEKIKIRLSV
jgi:heparan-alpha-glucosaminide N-acetyltransferase